MQKTIKVETGGRRRGRGHRGAVAGDFALWGGLQSARAGMNPGATYRLVFFTSLISNSFGHSLPVMKRRSRAAS